MGDLTEAVILLMGLALLCGILIGSWATNAIREAQQHPTAAEIAMENVRTN